MQDAPIGVFDSGLGGLSVLQEISRCLPQERCIYVADSAYVPYGEKSTEQIVQRCLAISEFLLTLNIKVLVVACNTATAAAIGTLRERWLQLPCIGMEPAVKPATRMTRNGKVGVLATTGTLRSARFAALLDRFCSNVQVYTQPCPGLVELIEAGNLQSAEIRSLLSRYVQPLLAAGCDTVILGCTHYPFLKPLLRDLLPADIEIIDTGAAVAARVRQQLAEQDLLRQTGDVQHQFYTTGSVAAMQAALPALWPEPALIQQLQL